MEDITRIVKREVIDKMNKKLVIKSITGNSIVCCNVKWSRIGKSITDENGIEYKIVSVDYDEHILGLDKPFTGTLAVLKPVLFLHGTPKEVNIEWGKLSKNESEKIPLIWLVEPVDETPYGRGAGLERESNWRVVFIENYDARNWTIKDIHSNRAQSLVNLKEEFMNAVEKNPIFKPIDRQDTRYLNKLGSEGAQGFEKDILNANLTALDLRVTVPIYKTYKNCDC